MACVCGATYVGHCPYCRQPWKPDPLSMADGQIKLASDSVIIMVGPPNSGKTTIAFELLSQLGGGYVVGNEMSNYDPWSSIAKHSERVPLTGHVVIDSLETVRQPKLLKRRHGVTLAIARLNAQGGLYGGMADMYNSDITLVLYPDEGQLEIHKTRYQHLPKPNRIRFPYEIDWPSCYIGGQIFPDAND